jgi:hypothetical protein
LYAGNNSTLVSEFVLFTSYFYTGSVRSISRGEQSNQFNNFLSSYSNQEEVKTVLSHVSILLRGELSRAPVAEKDINIIYRAGAETEERPQDERLGRC